MTPHPGHSLNSSAINGLGLGPYNDELFGFTARNSTLRAKPRDEVILHVFRDNDLVVDAKDRTVRSYAVLNEFSRHFVESSLIARIEK